MKKLFLLAVGMALLAACTKSGDEPKDKSTGSPENKVRNPERAKSATIYEVNIRQHTPEGTFAAFSKHLGKIRDLGADILWIMPVQPIGEKNRKGSLGSYYSIKDYKSVNPEFGTLDDFRELVKAAHSNGLQVILDWVPNHTAWDHSWMTDHPEYYMTDSAAAVVGKVLGEKQDYYKKSGNGNLVYEADWNDIALLNLYNAEARKAMIDAMKFWVTETDIDGFRADHAGHEIPMFFWEEATAALNPVKDLFWLAEWDEPRMHLAFHATYEWGLMHLTEETAKGNATAEDLHEHIRRDVAKYGLQPFRLNMITNHDRNAWEGTIRERYGDGEKAFAVFSFSAYGVPVLYSGQEAGLNKRLRFFDKDTINWDDPGKYYQFYQQLNTIKEANPALWNGAYGGMPEKIEDQNINVFSFRRTQGDNTVYGIINLSAKPQKIVLPTEVSGRELFSGNNEKIRQRELQPWQYLLIAGG